MTNTVIEMVKATNMEYSETIAAFILAQGKAITVPMIEDALDELFVAYKKKMSKATKIDLLARALEMDMGAEAFLTMSVADANEKLSARAAAGELSDKDITRLNSSGIVHVSAAGESPVAETKQKEEDSMSLEEKAAAIRAIRASINAGQAEAEVRVKESRFQANLKKSREGHDHNNPVSEKVDAQIEDAVKRFYARLGEFRVEILRVVPVQNDRFGRVGYMDVKFPNSYAMVGIWIDEAKKKEWYEFAEFNYNQMVRREKWSLPYNPSGMVYNLELGEGIIRLAIREDANKEVYVRMPMDKGKEQGVYFDVFRTSDIRWGRPNSSNNGNVEAALTAALRFYWKELRMENPENRYDFDASCMKCRNMQWFGMRDGIDDDLNIAVKADELIDNPKSTRILNQPDVETLAQKGTHIMQAFCTKRKFFVDREAVEMINSLSSEERRYYDIEVIDEITGETRIEQRFQGRDEVIVAGKPIKVRDIREESSRETCRNCPFYHKSAYKGENQIGHEIVEAREKLVEKCKTDTERSAARKAKVYVNEYWTTRARAGRQSFETYVDNGNGPEWIPGFPVQVTDDMSKVLDIRVAGIGVNVYFGDELMGSMEDKDFAFMPAVETFDEKESKFNKVIGIIYYAAFNRNKMSKAKFEEVTRMIYVTGMPEDLTEKQVERWNNAVYWFEESLKWAAERVAASNRPDYAQKFYAGIDGYMAAKGLKETPDLMALGVREVHIEEVLFETINRVVNGTLRKGYEDMFEAYGLEKGYEDLQPKDFIRFLDDVAMDYVLDSLVDGAEYVVVGGKKSISMDDEEKFAIEFFGEQDKFKTVDVASDANLVAATMQLMLQRQINGLLYGVNRSENKVDAFTELNICEEALLYVAQHAGLLK